MASSKASRAVTVATDKPVTKALPPIFRIAARFTFIPTPAKDAASRKGITYEERTLFTISQSLMAGNGRPVKENQSNATQITVLITKRTTNIGTVVLAFPT